jgi:hypothetical protein
MALNSAMCVAPGFESRSAQSHLSLFRTNSWADCVLGFWWFPLYELHVYSSMWSEAKALSEYGVVRKQFIYCDPETRQRSHQTVKHSSARLLPLLQPPPATDRQHAQSQVDLACSEVVSLPRKAAADTLGHLTVVPGVTKPWMTRDVADACARRRLAFARNKLDPCPVNLDRFKAADELARMTCRAAQ